MKKWITKKGIQIIQVLSGRSNVFLISNGLINILIDTSPKLFYLLLINRLNKFNIKNIDYLILTHTHYDHAANAFKIKQKYNCKIIVHKNESEYLGHGTNPIITGSNIFTKFFIDYFAPFFFKLKTYHGAAYDISINDNYRIPNLSFDLLILHTPGHSLGSVSVIVDNEIAFVGDTLFGMFKKSTLPPFINDFKQLISSWLKLLNTNCNLFLPAHGNKKDREQLQKCFNYYNKKIS